jgi:hypothetical protein
MERYDPAMGRCSFGLLCMASSIALALSGIAMLVFR